MILGFSVKFKNGNYTLFPEKILRGYDRGKCTFYEVDRSKINTLDPLLVCKNCSTIDKIHTIRSGSRWQPGMKIHFATGVRTKKYHCFAIGECKIIQDIKIEFFNSGHQISVEVDRRKLSFSEIIILAKNDGLTGKQFVDWFYNATNKGKEIFHGQIIHWTDLKY